MSKSSNGPSSLSEAIQKLEAAGQSKSQEIKEHLEKDFEGLKKSLEQLKPQLDEFKDKIETGAQEAKHQVEEKVKEHPWLALGIVGLIAFFLGWILSQSRRRE